MVPREHEVVVLMSRHTFGLQFHAPQVERLRSLGHVGDPIVLEDLDSEEARRRLATADVLLTSWGAPALTVEHLDAAPRLRAVLHAAGSVRSLLPPEAWDRGIRVTTAAEENARPVAEFALAAIIMAGKGVPAVAARAGATPRGWRLHDDLSNRGRTIGVVGFSRIGRRVTRLVQEVLEPGAVLVSDPTVAAEDVADAGARLVELPELLASADVVSLHAPALPSTHHLIGAAELALMRDGATLVNTARGSLVDTAALERECVTGRLQALLDVTDPEPLPAGSPLMSLPNVLITPHVAGSLGSEVRRMSDAALGELERFVRDDAPLSPVHREHLEVSA
ncbi:hydroxyacid dehydrogenase [Isoptericola sp. NPDC056578]|uniref:hydroxyacid dehydrogenase n=1 Tax=Isoptericola sp. NPDC056578 TaxID=3345870 RepID=UPI0036936FF5